MVAAHHFMTPVNSASVGLFAIIAIGFVLGMRHATDPDHVIAVSTIVTRERKMSRAALIGAAWGVGHTLTILLVGSAIILFRVVLPTRLGLSMELAVGVMLVWLGIRNVRALIPWSLAALRPTALKEDTHPHYHTHGDYVHVHSHAQPSRHPHDPQHTPVAALDRRFSRLSLYRLGRPLLVGTVHGLAGSAAVALLVLSAIPNPRWAALYLAIFGLGTVLGMMMITFTLGATVIYSQKRFAHIGRQFAMVAGLISIGFGLFITYQIGFVNGLFTSHASWVPR